MGRCSRGGPFPPRWNLSRAPCEVYATPVPPRRDSDSEPERDSDSDDPPKTVHRMEPDWCLTLTLLNLKPKP